MRKFFLLLVLLFILSSLTFAQPCKDGERRQCGETDEGACSYGEQICRNGQWTICLGAINPVDEICGNNKDDDCDGLVDEGCECRQGEKEECGETDVGICEYGYRECVDGEWGVCVNETKPLLNEICGNNKDDDCDGEVDEGCSVVKKGTCFNNVKDGDETGVDCGGSCKACVSCEDGILNQGEEKIKVDLGGGNISDCGGPKCPPCPTCFDGVKNQGEREIDCGGPCKKCISKDDEDLDEDGLSYRIELQKGTDPNNPDTDGDGIKDKEDKFPLCPNGLCDDVYGENEDTCPEDCKGEFPVAGFIILIIILVLILSIGVFFYYQFKKGTKGIGKSEGPKEKIVFKPGKYRPLSDKKLRKTKAEKELEKSLERAEKFFK